MNARYHPEGEHFLQAFAEAIRSGRLSAMEGVLK